MVSTRIHELSSIKNLDYIKNILILDKSDEKVSEFFASLIQKSLESTKILLNNIFYNVDNY
jgi:hypothetical protein